MESLKKFTTRFTDSGNEYVNKSFVFLALFILARLVEIVWISTAKAQSAGIGFQLYGLLYDILFALQLIGYLFLPYLGLHFIHRRVANVFFIVLTDLLIIGYLALIAYFK